MRISNKKVALGGLFGAITLLLGFTYLGYIPIPTPAGAATIMHIPVIISGLLLGVRFGAITGTIFGLSALYYFSSIAPPWVLFPARPLIGVVSAVVYRIMLKFFEKRSSTYLKLISLAVASFLGSMTNTIGTLGLAVIFKVYTLPVVLSILPQGIVEAILAVVISIPIVLALEKRIKV
jgi:uncharacterized membrane protein